MAYDYTNEEDTGEERYEGEAGDLRREVAELKASSLTANVRAFHDLMGVSDPARPVVPDTEVIRLRARLITEEYIETMHALFGEATVAGAYISKVHETLLVAIHDCGAPAVDFPEFIDGLADMAYVIEGSFLAFGVDSSPVHALVHRANMAKRGGPVVDGKQRKPEGWQPPDVAGELARQSREAVST